MVSIQERVMMARWYIYCVFTRRTFKLSFSPSMTMQLQRIVDSQHDSAIQLHTNIKDWRKLQKFGGPIVILHKKLFNKEAFAFILLLSQPNIGGEGSADPDLQESEKPKARGLLSRKLIRILEEQKAIWIGILCRALKVPYTQQMSFDHNYQFRSSQCNIQETMEFLLNFLSSHYFLLPI